MGEAVSGDIVSTLPRESARQKTSIEWVPLEKRYMDAVRGFNQRLRDGGAQTDFLIPEEPAYAHIPEDAPIQWRQFVAREGEFVRGGVIEMEQPAWLLGETVQAFNYQSPLSEGIIDKKSTTIALQMVRFMQGRGPHVFIVGMGSAERPMPRLLKAAGWTVQPIPFLFRVHRAGSFLRQLRMLQGSPLKRVAAKIAASTGTGAIALAVVQARKVRPRVSVRVESSWGDWADEIWNRFRGICSFTVLRDRKTLETLYPTGDPRMTILLIERNGQPVGWSVSLDTQMKDNHYFGNLRLASILDTVAEPESMAETAAAVDRELGSRGADMVFVNHSHQAWIKAFRTAGFLSGPSNFLLGLSKPLARALGEQPGSEHLMHITRGDGDGRCNL